jgi:hypothetical protein
MVRQIFGQLWIWIKQGLGETWRAIWAFKWFRLTVSGIVSVFLLWQVFLCLAIFDVFGLNTKEDGWQAGILADYHVSNRLFQWLPFPFFPTGEGYLLLGTASSRGARLNGQTISPSNFSTSTAVFQNSQSYVSQPVAMHYRRIERAWFLGGETDIRVTDFEKQVPATVPDDCSVSHDWLTKSYGTMGGLIVEVTKVGDPLLWKTNEVIIHTGGNEFKEMSITDAHIYECAIMALKTGQTMLIAYDNRVIRDPVTQQTSYNLIGISSQK